ncbi:MAG: MFS transporter [Chloroflexi bacterium]|nr:MFS transporter [Chloroflexota bacterium]
MDSTDWAAEQRIFDSEVRRHFRWNFTMNAIDGALFWLGMSFAAATTIIPLYVRHLTDSRLLIGLVATIAGSGWYLPQLLTANYIERLPRKKPVVVNIGIFTERVPFLVMAVSVFLFAVRSPGIALFMLFLTLIWHTLGAGLIAVAWQEMVAKVIPVDYRGRALGVANSAGTAMGVLGAATAGAILYRFPFPQNYGLCFSLAFAFILLSTMFLALIREPPLHSHRPAISLAEYGQRLPELLRQDRNFAWYLLARVLTVLSRMGTGFLTVYAVERWHLTDGQAGLYTTVMLLGQASANLLLGMLADRRGHKLVLEIALVLLGSSMVIALGAPSSAWMYIVFAMIGALNAGDILSGIAISMEFAAPDDRPTYLGLANTIPGIFAAVGPVIGGWIASRGNYTTTFLTAACLSMVSLLTLHGRVREPRQHLFRE